jgi:hypothetical protein
MFYICSRGAKESSAGRRLRGRALKCRTGRIFFRYNQRKSLARQGLRPALCRRSQSDPMVVANPPCRDPNGRLLKDQL